MNPSIGISRNPVGRSILPETNETTWQFNTPVAKKPKIFSWKTCTANKHNQINVNPAPIYFSSTLEYNKNRENSVNESAQLCDMDGLSQSYSRDDPLEMCESIIYDIFPNDRSEEKGGQIGHDGFSTRPCGSTQASVVNDMNPVTHSSPAVDTHLLPHKNIQIQANPASTYFASTMEYDRTQEPPVQESAQLVDIHGPSQPWSNSQMFSSKDDPLEESKSIGNFVNESSEDIIRQIGSKAFATNDGFSRFSYGAKQADAVNDVISATRSPPGANIHWSPRANEQNQTKSAALPIFSSSTLTCDPGQEHTVQVPAQYKCPNDAKETPLTSQMFSCNDFPVVKDSVVSNVFLDNGSDEELSQMDFSDFGINEGYKRCPHDAKLSRIWKDANSDTLSQSITVDGCSPVGVRGTVERTQGDTGEGLCRMKGQKHIGRPVVPKPSNEYCYSQGWEDLFDFIAQRMLINSSKGWFILTGDAGEIIVSFLVMVLLLIDL